MSITAEELIRQVRAAKTQEEESAIIETELSAIRSSFKLKDQPYVARNVAKVVYASMRGHTVTWADMGIVNLCEAAKNHKEKRLSYLALQLVPHDNAMYLKMASNNFKEDMESGSQYRASVAIAALSAVGTSDMLSELSASTLSLISRTDSIYLRKKALLLALKTTKASPEVAECFIKPCISAIQDKTHSICLTACQLGIELLDCVPTAIDSFKQHYAYFIKLLQQLSSPSYSSEDHEISGVSDPFLQTVIIKLISQLSLKHNPEEVDKRLLSEVLESVVSTPHRKGESVTARVAIEFEAAKAIMDLPNEFFGENEVMRNNLRASAADALTEALDHKNQTVRYSALAAITDIIHKTNETQGAQRHREVVLNCMHEDSITLRRRALNLLVLICDKQSAELVVDELIKLIGQTDSGRTYILKDALNEDIRMELISSVSFIAEMFATDVKWEFEVLNKCLELCGPSVLNDDLVRQVTSLSAREKSIDTLVVEQFSKILAATVDEPQLLYNETLLASSLYCIGELAGLLTEPEGVVNAIYNICEGSIESTKLTRYAISTLAKLITKCPAAADVSKQILQTLSTSFDPEIQQRAYEYSVAIEDPKANGLLGAIPPPPRAQTQIVITEGSKKQIKVPQQIAQQPVQPVEQVIEAVQQVPVQNAPVQQMQPPSLPGFAGVVPGRMPPPQFESQQPGQPMPARQLPFAMPSPVAQGQAASKPQTAANDLLGLDPAPVEKAASPIDDLFGNYAPVQQEQGQDQQMFSRPLYEDAVISVIYKAKPVQGGVEMQFIFAGLSSTAEVKAMYAAPTGTQCKMQQASGTEVADGRPPITQSVLLLGGNLALKIKLGYTVNGVPKEQMLTIQKVL